MKTSIEISSKIKANILVHIGSFENIDNMDLKSVLEVLAIIRSDYYSLISMGNPEEHNKYSEQYKQLSACLNKDIQTPSTTTKLLFMDCNQCVINIIHNAWTFKFYYSEKAPNMNNYLQFDQLNKYLPQYAPRLINVQKPDLFVKNIDQTRVPFCYIGTYGAFRSNLIKFLKKLLK